MYSISVAINTIELLAFVYTKQIANGQNKVAQFICRFRKGLGWKIMRLSSLPAVSCLPNLMME